MQPSNKSFYEYFSDFANERGTDVFLFDENKSYTVAKAFSVACGIADTFKNNGIGSGDEVVIRATRTVETILAFFATQILGAVAVLVDPHESVCGCNCIVDGKLKVNGNIVPFDFENGKQFVPFSTDDSPKNTIVIFTSGSTGVPKRVNLSQYNLINNSLDTLGIGGYMPTDKNIMIVPLHHVFGLALVVTAVVAKHAVFVPKSVDYDYVLECMERFGITRLNGVPSMYLGLAERKGERNIQLNCGLIGGGPYTYEQFLRIERELGITLIPVYGMSEFIGVSCADYKQEPKIRSCGVGMPYSMNEVKIADDGEIVAKGPALSNDEDVDENGFFHTGDLGYFDDDGVLHVSGRKKDIIIRNGNNISSVAIEHKILGVKGVRDVCVVGVTHEKYGEVPCAMVVADSDVTQEIYDALLKIEYPDRLIFSTHIPLTSSGKPDKRRVRELFELND